MDIEQQLKQTRQNLIETGSRSRLINFPKDSARTNSLEIVDELPNEVFRILFRDERPMSFLAGKEAKQSNEGDTDDGFWAPPEDQDGLGIAARHTDTKLQTRVTPEGLQRRLARLSGDAKSLESEQGVSALYLAFGFLRWFEDEKSETARFAPLILLPVELVRDSVRSAYKINIRQDDLSRNIALAERLLRDFQIRLPDIPDDENWAPSDYFARVLAASASQTRWTIDESMMVLGFFSFAKLSMYLDLDPENWPGGGLTGHGVINAVLGDGFEPADPLFADSEPLDKILQPSNAVHVVNADASQARAIEVVRLGRHLVIQGPPGTGKSETITNIIASAVKEGKTVLFVAEKLVALNVVHSRLAKAELGPICLTLHSRNANKKAVRDALRDCLDMPVIGAEEDGLFQSLAFARDQLNDYSAMLNEPLAPSGVRPFEALGVQSALNAKNAPPPILTFNGLESVPKDKFDALRQIVEQFARAAEKAVSVASNPWRGATAVAIQPMDRRRLEADIEALAKSLANLSALGADVARDVNAQSALTINSIAGLISSLDAFAGKPAGVENCVVSILRCPDRSRLKTLCATGKEFLDAYRFVCENFRDEAWDEADPQRIVMILRDGGGLPLSAKRSQFKRVDARVSALLKSAAQVSLDERLTLWQRLVEAQELLSTIRHSDEFGRYSLGETWQAEGTDFESVGSALHWLDSLPAHIDHVALAAAPAFSLAPDEVAEKSRALSSGLRESMELIGNCVERLKLNIAECVGTDRIEDAPIGLLVDRVALWNASMDKLDDYLELGRLSAALKEAGGAPVVDAVANGKTPPQRAVEELVAARAEAIWGAALRRHPRLAALTGKDRQRLVDRFRELEEQRRRYAIKEVRARHSANVPRGHNGQMGVIRGEIARKKGGLSVREIMEHAGAMVQKIKPVMLMSPLSVAQFLPPGSVEFDLLVIDEASQVRPEDALGAIARAKQVVVVGDQKQLPPTSFFDRLVSGGPIDDDDDDDGGPPIASAGEMESVLTLCDAKGMPSRMLQWHYRSRHPSLIAVSNKEFYKQLFVPPAPVRERGATGFHVRNVAGSYDRGGTKANRIEAYEVVQAVVAHARDFPGLSLGVATFSITQSRLIKNLVEAAQREDEALNRYILEKDKTEEFFVKNLENVQGDERDVIFVSIGYGPRIAGQNLDSMNFGPVSKEGGERRLNVLFTRARSRCEVFVSFASSMIDLSAARSEGARVLKQFLRFGETGSLDLPIAAGGFDSPFEEEVAEAIAELGYQADSQVGDAGFRIDLAVVNPERPGDYILAVECDGAAYHSAHWARERDMLRQQVLEGHGWRFHRIWSTDWFKDPKTARQKLFERIIEAKIAANTPPPRQADPLPPVAAPQRVELALAPVGAPPYREAEAAMDQGVAPHELPPKRMAELLVEILAIEGPVHEEELARRVARLCGAQRTGARILDAVRKGLRQGKSSGAISAEGKFFALPGAPVTVRSRADASASLRKGEMLPPSEIAAAISIARAENGGMKEDELVTVVSRMFGFERTGPDLFAAIDAIAKRTEVV